jgi:hypothetical protein
MGEMSTPDAESGLIRAPSKPNIHADLETGIAQAEEAPAVEPNEELDAAKIDSIYDRMNLLHGMYDAQSGLEQLIVESGLQVITDKYGADRVLDALQVDWGYDDNGRRPPSSAHEPSPGTMLDVARNLTSDKREINDLSAAIEADSMPDLSERLNKVVGGVSRGSMETVDGLERQHRFTPALSQDKSTDGFQRFITGDLISLLQAHPELKENFRATNDTVGLLKDIRDIYTNEYTALHEEQALLRTSIDKAVSDREGEVAELAELSRTIQNEEITNLEGKLASAKNPEAKEMIQAMIDKRAAEAEATRADFEKRSAAVRSQVIASGGEHVDYVYNMRLREPVKIYPITTLDIAA